MRYLILIFCLLPFIGFSQIQLVGNITTFGGGSYPTHIDSLGYGGLTVVADSTERNAITQLRRKVGMVVFQVSDSKLYYLDTPITENNWIPIESESLVSPDTAQVTIYCPAHGIDLTDYEGEFLPMFSCRGARATHIDSLQTYYAIDIPHVDSITIVASGLIYRPNHDLSDFIGQIVYLTNTVGAYDTIQGTVLSAIALVIDSNYINLLPRSVLESDKSLTVLVLPAPFLNSYLGDAKVPQDTAVQRLARLYSSVGLLKAGGKVITQTPAISDNPIYRSSGSNPVNPAMSWVWTGGVNGRVIKDKELLVAIDLEDNTYGGLNITPLDTVELIGGVPTDTTVATWLEDNVTNNKLRLPNGSLLYFVGEGSRQNPDYVWTITDDLSGNVLGSTSWFRLIKRIKTAVSFAEVDSIVLSLQNQINAIQDSLNLIPDGTGTNLRIPVWTGTNSLGSSTLLQSATGALLIDAGVGFRFGSWITANRPASPGNGESGYNSTLHLPDYYINGAWRNGAISDGALTSTHVPYINANGHLVGSTGLRLVSGVLTVDNGPSGDVISIGNNGFLNWGGTRIRAYSGIFYFANSFTINAAISTNTSDTYFAVGVGNVGIGIKTPYRKLHVAGEVRIDDLTTDTPTRIVGADADGDLGAITFGSGFTAPGGVLTGAFLPITGGTLTGSLLFTDNTYDIGASGLTRPRTGYFGTSVVSPIFNATTGFQIGGAAASGKILKANGTNFVASTETYAAPGSSGNIMTSDGTNWTSAAPAAAVVNLSLSGSKANSLKIDNSAGTGVVLKGGQGIGILEVAGTLDTAYIYTLEHWGEVSISGGSTSVTAATPERPDNDTPGTPTASLSSEFTQSGSTVTYIGAAGQGEIKGTISFSPSATGDYLVSLYQEGVEVSVTEIRVTSTASEYTTVSVPTASVNIATNDTFELRIEPVSGSSTITIHKYNVYARKIY